MARISASDLRPLDFAADWGAVSFAASDVDL